MYLSAEHIAQQWGVSARTVRNYAQQGRIPGAFLTGKTWSIPADAQKPQRKNKSAQSSPILRRLLEEKETKLKGGLYHRVQVDLTYNSNRIEGSKLSLDQTRLIFETATLNVTENIPVDDVVETMNHFRAIDFILGASINETTIKKVHQILKQSTTDENKKWFAVGDYKKLPNEVAGHTTTPPEDVESEIRQLLQRPVHTFEDIIAFHVAFERIHPFQDGNGRVGRLIMFKQCLEANITPFIISNDLKMFYYRGLSEWDSERGFLLETCREAQDRFAEILAYFRI